MKNNEEKIRRIVANTDINTALSMMHNRTYRQMGNLAREVVPIYDSGMDFGKAYVDVKFGGENKARRYSAAAKEFTQGHLWSGRELNRLVATSRFGAETHLVYGVGAGRNLMEEDYVNVMMELGLTEIQAADLVEPLLKVADGLKNRKGLHSILVG